MSKRKSTSQPQTKHRKGFLSVALPWLKRFGWASGITLLVVWISAWLIITGTLSRFSQWTNQQFITASAKTGLIIKDHPITGIKHSDPNLIKALINLETGAPLLSINPRQAQELLEKTKWVKRAHIQRHLPDTITINITERTPIARILAGKAPQILLDTSGETIAPDDISTFSNLILIKGKDTDALTESGLYLITHLSAQPTLHKRIKAAERFGSRRWNLTLDNGLIIKMPEDSSLGFAIERVTHAQKQEQIFEKETIESLDLRNNDRIIVETKSGKAHDHKNSAKNKKNT